MELRPLHDRLLVRTIKEDASSRIVIPDVAEERPQKGQVVAVGTGLTLDNGVRVPMTVQVNDVILFGKYSGGEVSIEGEKLLMLREGEVLAVLEE